MSIARKPNPLGELPAEADQVMLEAAFYETPDFRSLLEHQEYHVIVGRRGVGKSALFYRLAKTWGRTEHLQGLEKMKEQILLLIDRLDEGYEPDPLGIGLLVGLVHASVDINTRFKSVKSMLFLRDNIYRAVARYDPNFSRTVEGHVLRLHWDEYHLGVPDCENSFCACR